MGIPRLSRSRWIRVRIGLLVFALFLGAAAVAMGAWDLGVTRRDELETIASEQYQRHITVSARRGMITDRHGAELAVEVEVDSVYANAKEIRDPVGSASILAPILELDLAELQAKLASGRSFVFLKRRVAPALAEAVRKASVDGIYFIKESKRFYPKVELASSVLGIAGLDSVGLEGLELKFDAQLKGKRDAVEGFRDGRGRVVFADSLFGPSGVVGNSIELTIDSTLQYYAERELAATVSTYNAKSGQMVVMDPRTGEILAMASYPSFNPNVVAGVIPEQRRNRPVLDVFEPGSTMKVFTLAAAFNTGAVRPDDLIFCENGRYEMGEKKKVYIHDDHADGWLTPGQCLKRSSNICFAKMALELGKKRLYHYMRRFGFGDRTTIDLPFEAPGVLHHFKKWYDIDAATISFGQGIGVTGVQMATALSALANGGRLMKPYVVRRVVGPDREVSQTFGPVERRQVVSEYTARLVGDVMTTVTEEGGTGVEGALEGYLVAAKTGTAQKSVGRKGYHEEKWVASFFGFMPADSPRLVISVVIDEPLISHYGGVVAAPALRRFADQAMRYLGVSPRMMARRDATPTPRSAKVRRIGAPKSEPDTEAGEAPLPEVPQGSRVVPQLSGMTMRRALVELSESGLRAVFSGTGVASEQAPAPGTITAEGDYVHVSFAPMIEPQARDRDPLLASRRAETKDVAKNDEERP
jgi:cell division protein FtsI (penicillin-binding protein 3)